MTIIKALLKKYLHNTRNIFRILSTQSRFKIVFISAFASAFTAGMFMVFLDAFSFLDRLGGVGLLIITKLFSLFFLGMGIMLAVSSIVSTYTTLYRSREVTDLLSRPMSIRNLVIYKFLEAAALSSWAFYFVIIPFIGAYAFHEKLSLVMVIWTFVFSVPFIIICCGIGALFTIITVRFFPSIRLVRIIIILSISAIIASSFLASHMTHQMGDDMQLSLSRLIPGLNIASNPLIPSYWVADGITELSTGNYTKGLLFLALCLHTAIIFIFVLEIIGTLFFLDGWRSMSSGTVNLKRGPLLFPSLGRLLLPLGADVKAMVLKDIRIFIRDPMQWSQALIFFGLLALYFANIRSFRYHTLPVEWRNMMAFLNVFSVAAVMCSLGSRFIYPQLSLEGQNFWVIGLSPVSMRRILLTKFAMAGIFLATTGIALMLLSCSMLKTDTTTLAVSLALATSISIANAGLSTGLGAVFLELRESNPVAIVSGYGGTMNLVLNLLFMIITILPYAYIFQLRRSGLLNAADMNVGVLIVSIWVILLTLIFTAIPLYLGLRTLKSREY